MKQRKGFVSNSSSSSFIIASKEDNPKATVEIDLDEIIEDRAETLEELDAIFERDYCWRQTLEQALAADEFLAELYAKCKDAIERGLCLHFGLTNNYGSSAHRFFYSNTLKGRGDYEVISEGS